MDEKGLYMYESTKTNSTVMHNKINIPIYFFGEFTEGRTSHHTKLVRYNEHDNSKSKEVYNIQFVKKFSFYVFSQFCTGK